MLQIDLGGFNLGLVCLGVNLLVLTAVNLTAKPSRAHALG